MNPPLSYGDTLNHLGVHYLTPCLPRIPSAEGCRDPAEGILADKRKRRRYAGVACVIKKWYWSPFKVMGPMPVLTIPFGLCHSLEVFGISFF